MKKDIRKLQNNEGISKNKGKMKDGEAWKIMNEILKKSPTKKEWMEQSIAKGVPQSTFYSNFNKRKDEYENFRDEKGATRFRVLTPVDRADSREIDLYLGYIGTPGKTGEQAMNDLIGLATGKNIVYHTPAKKFIETALKDPLLYKKSRNKILALLRLVIARALRDGNTELAMNMVEKNKDKLTEIIREERGEVTKKELEQIKLALAILALVKDKGTLELIYELITTASDEEMKDLWDTVVHFLKKYSEDYRVDIRKRLYDIFAGNFEINSDEKEFRAAVKNRAFKLLQAVS